MRKHKILFETINTQETQTHPYQAFPQRIWRRLVLCVCVCVCVSVCVCVCYVCVLCVFTDTNHRIVFDTQLHIYTPLTTKICMHTLNMLMYVTQTQTQTDTDTDTDTRVHAHKHVPLTTKKVLNCQGSAFDKSI